MSSSLKKVIKYVKQKCLLPLYYHWHALWPVDPKLVLFADVHESPISDNFWEMYDLCEANGYTCVFLSGESYGENVLPWERKKAKRAYQYRFLRLFARCSVLFLVDHFPLADIPKRRAETQVVQLWHACGILKRWGYATTGNAWGASPEELRRYPIYINQTLSTISANTPCIREAYQAAFNCDPEIIKALGSPRTDIYFDQAFCQEARRRIQSKIPNLGDRKILLYAPSFRGKSISKSHLDVDLDFLQLKKSLSDQYVFVIKFHPLMQHGTRLESARLRGFDFVYNFTNRISSEEALCAADILITDYSSIVFDYMLFEKPIISFIYDIDQYIEDRGLFLPYEEVFPGPYVFSQKELTEKLLTVDQWFDREKIRRYKLKYMSACDGYSTERIYREVFGAMPKNMSDRQAYDSYCRHRNMFHSASAGSESEKISSQAGAQQ